MTLDSLGQDKATSNNIEARHYNIMKQPFEDILFDTDGIGVLAKELSRPFTQVSIIHPNKSFLIEKTRWIGSVTLWGSDRIGLKITPKMHDIDYRLEVGSLYFERVMVADQGDEFYTLPNSFSAGTLLQKLILTESRKHIESGINIIAFDESQILVVPNAMPFSLAMRCTGVELSHFEPEYSLGEYAVEVF